MSEEHTETSEPRVRAWMLIQANDASSLAKRIYDALGFAGGNRWIVIRADVVDWSTFNIVIPLDTESQAALNEVSDRIRGMIGSAQTALLRVLEHNPWPPHLANGFIDGSEAEADPKWRQPTYEIGRLHHSPGHNPWG